MELLPPAGTEVRATLASDGGASTAQGTLVEASEGGLVLEQQQGRRVFRVPADALLGLERSLGRDHARGALTGFAFGVLGGAVVLGGLAAFSSGDEPGCVYFCSRSSNFLVGAVIGGAMGGGLGLVVGGAVGTTRWQRVW